ncbi:MAG: isoprenyl transferase [Erysipelotrichaceae bacterium]|nr:isoprenyl transferase [Erysipelotrichaceae bacterium]
MSECKHVAIIMDGNGRWAKSKGYPRTQGHLVGTDNVRNIAIAANDAGIKALTVYAFSTENWKRSKEEVDYLMKLPFVFFKKFIDELMEKNIKITMIGEMSEIPKDTAKVLQKAIDQTSSNTGMVLNFAMNYGSRNEIVRAVNNILNDVKSGKEINVTEENFNDYLYTNNLPEVDLVIRTSGEQRISNFLLWQIAYSELIFTDVPWPEFTPDKFLECLDNFKNRDRRFGGIK